MSKERSRVILDDKENLESIKLTFELMEKGKIKFNKDYLDVFYEDMYWVIEQAQKVPELDEKLEIVMDKHTYLEGEYYEKEQQNKRYREAIQEIKNAIPLKYKGELELSAAFINITGVLDTLESDSDE